jgi:hypothetical protein
MKLTILFLLFSCLFLLNSTLNLDFLEELSGQDDNIITSACKIVNDVTGAKNETQDILVGHIGSGRWSQGVNDLTQCIDGDKTVVVTNLRMVAEEKRLRKASVIVLIAYQADRVSLIKIRSSRVRLKFSHLG